MKIADEWEKTPPKSLADAVTLAKALRIAADDGEGRLMRYLRWLESSGLWKEAGDASFDAFLASTNICKSSRYRDSVRAFDTFGADAVEAIGLQAAVVATKVPEAQRDEAMKKLAEVRAFNGVPASRQNAASVLSHAHLLPPVAKTRAGTVLSRVAELESANKTLRKQLEDERRLRGEAEKRAAALEHQLRKAGLKPSVAKSTLETRKGKAA